ncbi:histidinol-phosphate transaminase [bacterium]|nr:histidinol-phosphate transaminase [bacterium]
MSTPSENASNETAGTGLKSAEPGSPRPESAVESALGNFRPLIRSLKGYSAPPQGEMIAKLNQNENPYDIPAEWKDDILESMRSLEWTRYPVYDPPDLRAKLAARLGVEPDRILLGNGSNQILYLLGTALLSPGDRVVISPPTFSLFDTAARIAHGTVIPVDQDPDFSIDGPKVLAASRNARLTFVCSPDNPTGHTVPPDFLEAVCRGTSGLVAWDEAYGEFWGETAVPLIERHPNLVILKTFSKAFGLAGLRLGYLIGHPSVVAELKKVNIPFNVNLMSNLTALKLLDRPEWVAEQVARILSERNRLSGALRSVPGITPFPSAANFILMRTPDGDAVYNGLRAEGILVRPTEAHPLLKNCLRVTVGKPDENEAFLAALHRVVKKVQGSKFKVQS